MSIDGDGHWEVGAVVPEPHFLEGEPENHEILVAGIIHLGQVQTRTEYFRYGGSHDDTSRASILLRLIQCHDGGLHQLQVQGVDRWLVQGNDACSCVGFGFCENQGLAAAKGCWRR